MIRLIKLSVSAFAVVTVAACGALEPKVVPVSTSVITPSIVAAGKVVSASDVPASDVPGSNASDEAKAIKTGSALPADPATGSATGLIEQIYQTDRCNDLSRGGFIWFTETVGFDDWLSPLSPELVTQVKSKVDFSKQGVLLVDYGIAGTGGVATTVASKRLELKGSEAIVKVKRFEPSSTNKKRRAQVVTHPCSLHVMPRTGFSTLVVHSEQGDRLISFANTRQ